MFNILVAEDDKELRELFCNVLSENGYAPVPVCDGEEALIVLDHQYVDLIVSDIMMPKMDGYELTKALRSANSTVPILMITAKSSIDDKQNGFRAGIDDYMIKPINVNEMVWRISALLRRAQIVNARTLSIDGTFLDCDTLTVTYNSQDTILPQKEFLLLFKLLSSIGRIFTRRQLIDEIWGIDYEGDSHTLEVHIGRLRDKFKDNPDFEIITVRGLGYKTTKKTQER